MKKEAFGRPWTPRRIEISQLRITSLLQRGLDESKVARIIREFDPVKVNVVKVCRYPNGLLAVCDGQHTVTALRRMFDNIEVDCEVTDIRDDEEFAGKVFAANSPINSKISKNDVFWISGENKDKEIQTIHLAASSYGYEIVRRKTNCAQVDCVASILRVHREGGLSALHQVFAFARETFDGQKLSNYHIEGIHLFLKSCSSDRAFRRDRVIAHLKETPFPTIERQVMNATKGPGLTKSRAFAIVLRDSYNDRNGKGSADIRADID